MKQVKFILPMLLMVAAIGNVWGATPETATFTMKNSGQSSPVTVNGVTFTWTSSNIVVGTNNGSGFKANSNMTITIPSGATLVGIEKGNGNTWGSGAQIDVYAGTSSSGTKLTTITKDTHTYTISNNNTGTTYYFANISSKNAWINTLTIKYTIGSTKTLDKIDVKTAPTKTTYTEGEFFAPAGLVITKTYSDKSTEDVSYADHSSDFTFSPTTSTALQTSHTSVTITVGGKSTTQTITVNAVTKYTITFIDKLQGRDGYAGPTGHTLQVVDGATFTFPDALSDGTPTAQQKASGTCEQQHYHFVGWILSTEESTANNTGHANVKEAGSTSGAVSAAATYYAVWAREE